MDPRINLVTLGVADVARSRAFYERLGWRASKASVASTAFFQLGPTVLSIFGRGALAEDAGVSDAPCGFSGVALAQNCRSKGDVDAALKTAQAAGGRIVQPARDTAWGGYSGYFADPDGHLWEVAWNPHFALDEEGRLKLPK
jgi:catechol 2,3-dioxygenase-like lactoylglutathione lyase family enzyme